MKLTGELSLIKKKSFLLWYLRKRIENVLQDTYEATNFIQSRPKQAYTEISGLMEDGLKKHLTMLKYVSVDDVDNINSIFDHYKEYYPSYIKEID